MDDQPLFTPETFDLFEQIGRSPTAAFYQSHRAEFKALIEQPFQSMLKQAGLQLPSMMRARLEINKKLFGRFLKNDFGQGGAYSSYWGAFYPRDSRRIADVQLAVWMDASLLQISFYIGDYGLISRARFRENCQLNQPELLELLADLRLDLRLRAERWVKGKRQQLDWADWFLADVPGDYLVRLPLTPEAVLAMPGEDLIRLIAQTHSAYFPLALLAKENDPMPWIRRYLDV